MCGAHAKIYSCGPANPAVTRLARRLKSVQCPSSWPSISDSIEFTIHYQEGRIIMWLNATATIVTTPTPQSKDNKPDASTLIFGVLATVLAAATLIIGAFQVYLRHRRKDHHLGPSISSSVELDHAP